MKRSYIILISILLVLIVMGMFITRGEAQKRTLYWGSRNNDVKTLQWKLLQWGYYDGRVDGVFGADTAQAVKEFQRKNGLRIDGIVGIETWAALGYKAQSTTGTAYAANTGASRDNRVYLLARLIHAEARGEPYEGQVAVAAVLLNRVESPSFPNTLSGVIYQPLAFESVANGQINLPANSENVKAARAALNGWDPTYGCLFFWNPSKPVNRWIWSRQTVRTIGSHIFAY